MCDIKVIFGGAGISPQRGFGDADAVSHAMGILAAHGIDTIDTARFYDQSELILGNARAAGSFLIDTKVSQAGGLSSGSSRHHELWESLQTSLKTLKTDQVSSSCLTGGFLAQSNEEVRNGEARFRTGSFWWNLRASSFHLEALEIWRDLAADLNCEPAEVAYRWLAFHSSLEAKHGDGIILGSCGIPQLERNLLCLNEGPLNQDILSRFDALWHEIEKQREDWF